MSEEKKPTPDQQLVDFLGFDPASAENIPTDLFREVLGEIEAEKKEERRKKAKETVEEATKIYKEFKKLEVEFEKSRQKMHQSLGALMKRIQGAG